MGALLRGVATDPKKWDAMLEFSKKVIDRKEEVEREQQADERRNRLLRETEEILRVRSGETRRRTNSSSRLNR